MSLYQIEMQLRKYITNSCFALALDEMQQYLYRAQKLFFSTLLTARGKVLRVVKDALNKFLPANAHQLASGKLHIVLTRLHDWNCVTVSEFASKEDIIQVRASQVWVPSQQPQMSQHSQGQEIFATLPSKSLTVFPIGSVMQLLHPSVFWLYPSSVPWGGEYFWGQENTSWVRVRAHLCGSRCFCTPSCLCCVHTSICRGRNWTSVPHSHSVREEVVGVDLDYMGQCSGLLPERFPQPQPFRPIWDSVGKKFHMHACDTAHSEKSKAQGSLFSLLALYWWGIQHVEDQLRVPDHHHRVCFSWRIWHLSQRLPSSLLHFPNSWLDFTDIRTKLVSHTVPFPVSLSESELLPQVPRATGPLQLAHLSWLPPPSCRFANSFITMATRMQSPSYTDWVSGWEQGAGRSGNSHSCSLHGQHWSSLFTPCPLKEGLAGHGRAFQGMYISMSRTTV